MIIIKQVQLYPLIDYNLDKKEQHTVIHRIDIYSMDNEFN